MRLLLLATFLLVLLSGCLHDPSLSIMVQTNCLTSCVQRGPKDDCIRVEEICPNGTRQYNIGPALQWSF